MSIRSERVARLVQREIAEIINQNGFDGGQALTTVTHVRVSKDLSIAYVYVSVLGSSSDERKSVFRHLSDRIGQIRTELAQRIRHQVRIIPEVRLFLDETEVKAERIDRILDRIRREKESLPEEDAGESDKSSR